MRVAHVVAAVSADGAYGGPLRVAVNLANSLKERGIEVQLLASYRGDGIPPQVVQGVRARMARGHMLYSRLGYSSLVSPGLLWTVLRHGRSFDLVHIHLSRDMVTLPVALILVALRVPYVVQTHGMITESDKWAARLLDALWTRGVLRRARRVFYLNSAEESSLRLVNKRELGGLTHLPNGVPVPTYSASPSRSSEVLFLARLHARKRPVVFVQMALRLVAKYPSAVFTLIGPDEGEAAEVVQLAALESAEGRIKWEGAIEPGSTARRMSQAAVYVLPAVDEPWGMSVLESMSVGVPCVVTDSCGLVDEIDDPQSLNVADESLDSLTAQVDSLMASAVLRDELGRRARDEVATHFGIDAVGRRLLLQYELVLGFAGGGGRQ